MSGIPESQSGTQKTPGPLRGLLISALIMVAWIWGLSWLFGRFTDDGFWDIGLPGDDKGRGNVLPQIASVQHAFKTPTLRNIEARAPYMHDGSEPTLEAVIDFYGPSDLLTMPPNLPGPGKTDADLAKANGARLLGGIVRDRPEKARQASALHHVSKDDPPFLILHGDQDPQVPPDQSQRLHARLREAGVVSELHIIPGAGHGGCGLRGRELLVFGCRRHGQRLDVTRRQACPGH